MDENDREKKEEEIEILEKRICDLGYENDELRRQIEILARHMAEIRFGDGNEYAKLLELL